MPVYPGASSNTATAATRRDHLQPPIIAGQRPSPEFWHPARWAQGRGPRAVPRELPQLADVWLNLRLVWSTIGPTALRSDAGGTGDPTPEPFVGEDQTMATSILVERDDEKTRPLTAPRLLPRLANGRRAVRRSC